MELKDIARKLPEEIWEVFEPLLPKVVWVGNGRPPCSNRDCLHGVLYVLVTGIPWEMMHRRFETSVKKRGEETGPSQYLDASCRRTFCSRFHRSVCYYRLPRPSVQDQWRRLVADLLLHCFNGLCLCLKAVFEDQDLIVNE